MTSSALPIAIAGASGRMGQMLIDAVRQAGDCVLSGALDRADSPALGQDAGAPAGWVSGVAVTGDLDAGLAGARVLIDFTRPEATLANLAANLVQVFASADRVLDLLEETPITPEVTNGGNTAFTGAAADHVTFAYGQETILNDLSLTVPKGQIVGITGKSGSGKSTLLRLFMRFWDAGSGKITFGGADIRSVNTAALRSQESFVTQDTELFADTIENNVRIANRNATHEQVVEACQKASLHDFITSLPQGYGTQVGELGGALSGGERQRIGVARAFLHDAPFVLMDEPTSNLDSLNEGVILKAVKEECRDKTVLLVSHRASTMAVANTVYSVESGRVS